jgi:hypothetical protein
MTQLLILVHGMGSHPVGWSDDIKKKLDEVASRYAAFKGGSASFTSQIEFAEVRYDGIFDHYAGQWSQSNDDFATFVQSQGAAWDPSALVKWLADPGLPSDTRDFFWSTAIDPILYRGTSIVRDDVRSTVMAQIVAAVTSRTSRGAVRASILAHSLGTIVCHDVLQMLASGLAGGNNSFTSARWNFDNLFFLADVCVLGPYGMIDLHPRKSSPYLVRPTSADPNPASRQWYANKFFSFRHECDPFVRWAPFLPDKLGIGPWGADFISPEPLNHYHSANTHGFMHYLDHPVVHIPLINNALGYFAITANEEADAIANYPVIVSPKCQKEIDELRQFVASLPNSCDDLVLLGTSIAMFYSQVKRAVEACSELAE